MLAHTVKELAFKIRNDSITYWFNPMYLEHSRSS